MHVPTCTAAFLYVQRRGQRIVFNLFNAPPRIEACTYKIDVKIVDKPVLNFPIKMILEGSPNEEGASMSDHLWLEFH